MNKMVCFLGTSLVAGCLVVNARTAHTGHLIVSLTDRETGGPITNATVRVRVQTKRSYVGHSTPGTYFRTETANANSNGIANLEFQFYYSDFDWWVRSPTHYCHRYRVGARNEWLGGVVEKSDYLNIDTNTVQGLAMYNELVQLNNNNDYFGFIAKFKPKSVTYTNTVIIRSASFYPKHNPRPMYTYDDMGGGYLPMEDSSMFVTNGLEVVRYKPVDFDMKECLVVSYNPNHDDSWDGPAGKVADFHIERFCVTTNGVKTTYGWIDFSLDAGHTSGIQPETVLFLRRMRRTLTRLSFPASRLSVVASTEMSFMPRSCLIKMNTWYCGRVS